ncbi:hypothetical protein HNR46_004261 [Haloferula luteola]|uniref:Uncharacterized protein n=1 Tax=Haloferula luteola TaxID=595692 RepID=A0A840VJM3_9BACT|nr:hypothetical protein [Haloferula luteola]MBB5353989.1 hypothetical protein [Haloferula luteola]
MILFSDRLHFSIGFLRLSDSVATIWRLMASVLREQKLLPKTFEVSQMWGHNSDVQSETYLRLNCDEVESLIEARNLKGFMVCSGSGSRSSELDFWIPRSPSNSPIKLSCTVGAKAKAPDDWSPLIERVMVEFETIGAWQWRRRYAYWQADSLLDDRYHRLWGDVPPDSVTWTEPKSHLMGEDKVRIDISKNPGRSKELDGGATFYPTAEMWLGPHFWQYAKCTKEEALAADFFIEKRDTPHYLYLKCWPEPFTRPDGEQGRMQQRLWKLFFHEDCEWPPGSGTICDEPMYGPPELMPGYKQNKST